MATEIATPSFGMGARVFWSFIWRVILWSILLGLACGVVSAAAPAIGAIVTPLGSLTSIAFIFIALGTAFRKTYRRYTVALVNAQGNARPRQFGDTLALWWSYFWRSMLVGVVFGVLGFGAATASTMQTEKMQASMVYGACQQQFDSYTQLSKNPQAKEQADAVAKRFHEMNCQQVLSQPQPEEADKEFYLAFGICMAVAWLVGLLAQFKIFQILLGKQYGAFRVRVTTNS